MAHRSLLRVGHRTATALLVGLMSLLVSCERGTETIVSPSPGQRLAPGGVTTAVSAGQYAHFYIHAFAEDWPLFMSDRVNASFAAATQVTFVYTSAGDANLGATYMQTRENGAQAAVDALYPSGTWACGTQAVLAHTIRRCAKGSAVAYYMRLPDGAPSGEGYGTRGSMTLLRDGAIATLTALDGSATYTSWADFTNTVRAIVDLESGNQGAPYVEVHAPDYNRTLNPGDHPDHLATADAVNAASSQRSWNLSWYVDYATENQPQNLTQAAHDVKQAAYYAYDGVMGAAGYGYGKYDASTQAWLWRTYYRSSVSVPPPPPAAPTALNAQALSSSRIDLAWTNNATTATSMEVERAPDAAGVAGTYALVATLGGTAASYSNTGLATNTRYWFRVRARNANGASAYSNEVSSTTLVPPAPPTGLAATASSSSQVALSWTASTSTVSGYTIERAPDNAGAPGTFAAIGTVASGTTSYNAGGLTGSTRYWFRVQAVTTYDVSSYTANVSATTLIAPATPTGLTATAASSSRINLAWNNVAGNTGYLIQRAPSNGGSPGAWAQVATVGKDATSYADQSGLSPATEYWYRVRSITATDSSAFTAGVNATTLDVPPLAPTNLTATAASATQINIAWTDNADNEASFSIERAPNNNGAPGVWAQLASVPANTTTYANTGLAASTTYWYRVRAVNAVGTSAYTNTASATTPAQTVGRTDFYLHAHQDDWQLFMGNEANMSYPLTAKMVFVYVSAGDANQGAPYWQTREQGAQASVDNLMGTTGTWTCAAQTVNAHAIHRCTRGKVVTYYLRLPDGATTGEGFAGRGSLTLLQSGSITSFTAMDGSTTYTSWTDLTNTIRGIVDLESGSQSAPYVEVSSPEYDRTLNASDHPDHLAVGDLVHAASATRSWNQTLFIDYRTQNMAINLTQAQHDVEQRLFYAYDNVVGGAGFGYSQFEASYQAWLWRSYSRRITVP